MNEKDTRLTFLRREIEVIKLRVSIPKIEEYKTVLLRLFNNQREDKDIIELNNFWSNNDIEMVVNLTSYMNDTHKSKEEIINHLKGFMVCYSSVPEDQVKVEIEKARIFEPYEDEFQYFDENNEFINNYIINRW